MSSKKKNHPTQSCYEEGITLNMLFNTVKLGILTQESKGNDSLWTQLQVAPKGTALFALLHWRFLLQRLLFGLNANCCTQRLVNWYFHCLIACWKLCKQQLRFRFKLRTKPLIQLQAAKFKVMIKYNSLYYSTLYVKVGIHFSCVNIYIKFFLMPSY